MRPIPELLRNQSGSFAFSHFRPRGSKNAPNTKTPLFEKTDSRQGKMTNQFSVVPAHPELVRDRSDIRELLLVVSAAKKVVAACILASVAAAWLFTKTVTPQYTAQSSLLVDSNKGQLSRPRDETSNFGVEIAEIETQLQILKSQKIALLVVDRLGLDRDLIFMGEVAPNPSNWLNSLLWRLLPAPATVERGPDRRHQAALRLADAM